MTEEKKQEELVKKYYKVDFAKLARAAFTDLQASNMTNVFFNTFSKDKVMQALQNPQKNEVLLRNVSNFLYILSPHYKRLCNYHAEMLTLDWFIEPYKLDISKVNINQFKKAYNKTLIKLDNMNIKHEILKCIQIVYREGIFYGYEYSTDDSYFIQKLDADYCRISSVEDGVYNFEFDFDYFIGHEERLDNYSKEFTIKYNNYKTSRKNRSRQKNKVDLRWQELSSDYSICIKTDETVPYPFPSFIGVLPDIYEIQDYKALKKANNEMQNYALISGNIPMKKKSDKANDFQITLDTAIEFGNKMGEEFPDQVGFILSVFEDMKLFRLSDEKVGTDKVEEATNNFWSATGVSKNLFADSGNTDAAIRYSVIADEQSVFGLLRQVERWINRKLKIDDKKYQFKINMLNTTQYNQSEKIGQELKSAQFGLPNKIKLATTMGLSQSSIGSMAYLENEILKIHDNWIPLQSSHTQNNDINSKAPTDEGGRPAKEPIPKEGEGDD